MDLLTIIYGIGEICVMALFLLVPFWIVNLKSKYGVDIPFSTLIEIGILLVASMATIGLGDVFDAGSLLLVKAWAPFLCPEGYQNLVMSQFGTKPILGFSPYCTGEMGTNVLPALFPHWSILHGIFWILSTILYFVLTYINRALRQKKAFIRKAVGIVVTAAYWPFFFMVPDMIQLVASPISDYIATSRYGAYYIDLHKVAAKNRGDNEKEKIRFFLDKGTNINGLDILRSTPLTKAAGSGNIKITRLLLERGADPNIGDSFGLTPLLKTVAEGNTGIIKVLLKNGADANLRNKNGATALMVAADHGRNDAYGDAGAKDIIALLVSNGADLKARDKHGKSVMDWAANRHIRKLLLSLGDGEGEPPEKMKVWRKGMTISLDELVYSGIRENDLETVKLVIEAGVDLSQVECTRGSDTPLLEAIKKRNPQIVEILLEKGADANAHSHYCAKPLIKAAGARNPRIVELLLKNGADVNAYDRRGDSALIIAAKKGTADTVKLLLDNGADVNQRDNEDNTALKYAAKGGHGEVVSLLLDRGAETDEAPEKIKLGGKGIAYTKDDFVKSAMKNDLEAIKLFLSTGFNADSTHSADFYSNRAYRGYTALTGAAEKGNIEIVKLLIENGADVNAKDRYRRTPIKVAVTNGHGGIVSLLAANGVDLTKESYDLLNEAMEKKYDNLVKTLIGSGADVNARHKYSGKPVLFSAIQNHQYEIAKILIENGADVNAREYSKYSGEPVLFSAIWNHQYEIAKILIENGADVNIIFHGRTPLINAILKREPNMVKMFIENGADVNYRDKKDETALTYAKKRKLKEIVELLERADATE